LSFAIFQVGSLILVLELETHVTKSFCLTLPEEAVLQMFKATSAAERDDYPVEVIVSTPSGTEFWQGEKAIGRAAFAEHL